jgi:hypothetical protein
MKLLWISAKQGIFWGKACSLMMQIILSPLSVWKTHSSAATKAGFEKLILENPNIGLQVIKNLSTRINWLTERVGILSFTNLEDRLYQVLTQVAREHGA